MSWTPKLVAVDADGTIVGRDDRIPEDIITALRAIDARGVPVVLVTGRSWLSAKLVLDQLNLPHQYCVCNNGATVVTYPPEVVVKNETFDPVPIIEVIRDHPSMVMASEEFGCGYKVSRAFPSGVYELHGEIRIVSLEELAREPVTRVILRDPVSSPEDFEALVARLDLHDLSHWVGGDNWLDLGPGAAGKDKGLAVAAGALDVDQADVLALGDSYNDIDLLRWAGRGVALADAPTELLQIADDITGGFLSGGTINELRKWFDWV
jgi:hydroxymethylpyrimidine pyrophosphatase-like HAD family hydrolase